MTNGHSVFNQGFNQEFTKITLSVSSEDYEIWKKDFTWDALHGIRYSQSFCNRFGITDYILYYKTGIDEADEYIRKTYIDNSS